MAAFLLLSRFHCPFLRFLLNFGSMWVYNLYKISLSFFVKGLFIVVQLQEIMLILTNWNL